MTRTVAVTLTLCFSLLASWRATADAGATPARADGSLAAEAAIPPAIDYAAVGPYLGIGGGLATGDLDRGALESRVFYFANADTVSGSFSLRAGYRFHPRLAAELVGEYQTGWKFQTQGPHPHATLSAGNLTANMKAFLTESQWQPFVLAGVGLGIRDVDGNVVFYDPTGSHNRQISDENGEAFIARVGLGLDVHLDKAWQVGGEAVYVIGSGELSGLDYATTTLVVAYNFH